MRGAAITLACCSTCVKTSARTTTTREHNARMSQATVCRPEAAARDALHAVAHALARTLSESETATGGDMPKGAVRRT